MSEMNRGSLEELQGLDQRMEKVRRRIEEFDPMLEEVEEPALALEAEVTTTRSRLQEIKLEERRLERSADEKRARVKQLQERLNTVRNIREEAAVQTEVDILSRALEADEQEALTLLDQIRKLEERLQESESALEEARAEVEPRRRALLEEQEAAMAEYASLKAERESYSNQVKTSDLRIYEAIKAGGRSVAVSALTDDGACGHCFNVIPIQTQAEIRKGAGMIRCEVCGVILTPPGPKPPEKAAEEVVADDPELVALEEELAAVEAESAGSVEGEIDGSADEEENEGESP